MQREPVLRRRKVALEGVGEPRLQLQPRGLVAGRGQQALEPATESLLDHVGGPASELPVRRCELRSVGIRVSAEGNEGTQCMSS